MSEYQLPDKPSELLSLAIKDLETLVKMGASVDMRNWVTIYPNRDMNNIRCNVCLAGAVMAGSLNNFSLQNKPKTHPSKYEFSINKKLVAIDSFGRGEIKDAFKAIKLDFPTEKLFERVEVYDLTSFNNDTPVEKFELFKCHINLLIKHLQDAGY